MKHLTESDVLRIIREEWALRVEKANHDLEVYFKPTKTSDETNVISPELKVKHKKSGYRYTVSAVGTNSVVLRTPEGDNMDVDSAEFERDYSLD